MTTIGNLIGRLALADIRRKQLQFNSLNYARQSCTCGHRRDEHEAFEGACIMPHETRCIAFVAEED